MSTYRRRWSRWDLDFAPLRDGAVQQCGGLENVHLEGRASWRTAGSGHASKNNAFRVLHDSIKSSVPRTACLREFAPNTLREGGRHRSVGLATQEQITSDGPLVLAVRC